ncbi:MAG: mandelate racemase/muconate lactonizing enzyme family protein [Candidatus Geothermarchaeales archaeon]
MKIERVEAIPVNIPIYPERLSFGAIEVINYVITRVYTDESVVGLGEAATLQGPTWSEESQESIKYVIDRYLSKAVLGEDPFCLERVLERMDRIVRGNLFAKAAIEFALYDIIGKTLGVPIYQLLGGLYRGRIPLSWTLATCDPELDAAEAQEKVKQGWRILKIKAGVGDPERDVAKVKRVREAVGDEVKVRVDANQGWDFREALRIMGKLEQYDVEFVEQPLPKWDLDGMARLASTFKTPIMADESVCTVQDALNIIKKGAASIFSLKMTKSGGISNSKKVAAIAEAAGIGCYVGCMIETGIGTAAYAHFAGSTRNVGYGCELFGPLRLEEDITGGSIEYIDGEIVVPKGPGLGVEIDDEKLEKYKVEF